MGAVMYPDLWILTTDTAGGVGEGEGAATGDLRSGATDEDINGYSKVTMTTVTTADAWSGVTADRTPQLLAVLIFTFFFFAGTWRCRHT